MVARVALRRLPPPRAASLVRALGRMLPALGDAEARRDAARLRHIGGGTCLTRAITVAARARGAEVVIGANPSASSGEIAHAWVERKGAVLTDPADYAELARLGLDLGL